MNSLLQNAASPLDQRAANERRARRFWLALVGSLLSAQVLGGIGTVYLATSDSSFSVVPDYYQAGLNWDVTQRNRQLFDSLGWKCQLVVSEADPQLKHRSVLIRILSSTDQPVENLVVKGQIYHHARGNDVHKLQFDASNPGEYITSIKLSQAGMWQINLNIEGDHGIAEENMVVNVDPR